MSLRLPSLGHTTNFLKLSWSTFKNCLSIYNEPGNAVINWLKKWFGTSAPRIFNQERKKRRNHALPFSLMWQEDCQTVRKYKSQDIIACSFLFFFLLLRDRNRWWGFLQVFLQSFRQHVIPYYLAITFLISWWISILIFGLLIIRKVAFINFGIILKNITKMRSLSYLHFLPAEGFVYQFCFLCLYYSSHVHTEYIKVPKYFIFRVNVKSICLDNKINVIASVS